MDDALQIAKIESLNREGAEERDRRRQLEITVNTLAGSDDPEKPTIVSAVLTAFIDGISRGGDRITPQKVVIPRDADLIRLRFPVRTDWFDRFNVSLIRINGSDRKEIWRKHGLTVRSVGNQELRVRIPGALLSGREYALELYGARGANNTESVGEYRFELVSAP